jgi:exonuclease III
MGWKKIMSHGTRHNCGVAILIPKHYKCDIKEVTIGKNGWSITLRGTFNDNNLTLLNYYAPTSDKGNEQQQQLQEILPTIHTHFAEIIWGGDMNMTLEPQLDKYKNTPGFCAAAIAVNSAEFAEIMTSADSVQIRRKSAFSASFSFLKLQNISIIKKVMAI